MNVTFNFKNFEPSDHLKNYAETRFQKLSKYIPKSENTDIQANLSVEKFRQMAEVIVTGDSLRISAYEETEDMYSTIDMILDKIVAQAKKNRDKKVDRKRGQKTARVDYLSFAEEAGVQAPTIIETDHYEPKPMDVDEAAMQLDSIRDEFLVFWNSKRERVNVIYKMKNGDYGLIDPGF